MQTMDSMAKNVHTGTCISKFYCDIALNGSVIFDAISDYVNGPEAKANTKSTALQDLFPR